MKKRENYIDITGLNDELLISLKQDDLTKKAYKLFIKLINLNLSQYGVCQKEIYYSSLYFLIRKWREVISPIPKETFCDGIQIYRIIDRIIKQGMNTEFVKDYVIYKRFNKK